MRGRRGFTLVELLVVVGIVSALMGLILGGLRIATLRAMKARARTELKMIGLALTGYSSDARHLPRLTARAGTPDQLLADDGPALYAALQNEPTLALGGGPAAPYVKGEIKVGRVTDRSRLLAASMGYDGETGVTPLTPSELTFALGADYQARHAPASQEPLVFLDPWGNPWHYREWATVPAALKEALQRAPVQRTGFVAAPGAGGDPPVAAVGDAPHDPYGWEVWSNGPNGVNELGAGDDVASWRDATE